MMREMKWKENNRKSKWYLSNFHFRIEFSPDRCAAPNLSADTILATFSRTCYEFHVTRGESYDKAQQICKSHGE